MYKQNKVRIYFTRKDRKKKEINFISYSPGLESNIQNSMLDIIKEYLQKFVSIEQIEFNPMGKEKGKIENYSISKIKKYHDLMMSFDENIVNRTLQPDVVKTFDFYCLEIENESGNELENIKFFKRVSKYKKFSSKKAFLDFIKNNRLNKIEENIIGADGQVDLITYKGEMLVLNYSALEYVFDLHEEYKNTAEKIIGVLIQNSQIENIEQFKQDCLNNKINCRKLVKLDLKEDILKNCLNNKEKISHIIESFNLGLSLSEKDGKPKLVYSDKKQVRDIIRIFNDSFYKSIIMERTGIDDFS